MKSEAVKKHHFRGTEAPWYQAWDLTDAEREVFRKRSAASNRASRSAKAGDGPEPIHPINVPSLDPESLMPRLSSSGIRALSLFSGCGGIDLGFDYAGFSHAASYEILEMGAATIKSNRPSWPIFGGDEGNVRRVNWNDYRGQVEVIHGGPPCQPFSNAGKQLGASDERDLFPEFVRAVLGVRPLVFVAENVASLGSKKFEEYLDRMVLKPLGKHYKITRFKLRACDFGVPQSRTRLIFVGTCKERISKQFLPPVPTHSAARFFDGADDEDLVRKPNKRLPQCMGAREALGLPDIGIDLLAPTIRSGLTGPRQTTSILSSTAALRVWNQMKIWPNGVQATREAAHRYVVQNGHFRLSVQDCLLLQGFPSNWELFGPVYMQIGLVGNSVAPPMAYAIARAVRAVF